jgi:hypothetical protein
VPRALIFQRAIVPLAERERYLQRVRTRRSYYRAANCRFWLFEETDLAGAFLEFIEAVDRDTLTAALGDGPDELLEGARIFREVELD